MKISFQLTLFKHLHERYIAGLYKVTFHRAETLVQLKRCIQVYIFALVHSISPPPSELRSLARRLRCRNGSGRMGVRTRWFGAEGMILTLLSGVREHAA